MPLKIQLIHKQNTSIYPRLFFSTHFRHFEHMDMPEPWVILISVELFWPESLSYFAENAWVIKNPVNWVILVKIVEFWWRNPFQKYIKTRKISIFLKENVISYNKFWLIELFSPYFIKNMPKTWVISLKGLSYFQNFELFCFRNPWVIFESSKKKEAWINAAGRVCPSTGRLKKMCTTKAQK